MFGKNAPPAQAPSSPRSDRKEQSFLQNGVRLKGEIEVDGDLRVEGTIRGSVTTRGLLMVGPKALIEGDIQGREVVIHGQVGGTVRAEERIQLSRGGRIKGDLYCRSLIIEEGVYFEGRSHMGEKSPPVAPAQGANKAPEGVKGKSGGFSPRPPTVGAGTQRPVQTTGPSPKGSGNAR